MSDQAKQEAYAKYANCTNKTLLMVLEDSTLPAVEKEVIQMILKGRVG
ncbi:hypothetical protein [Geobacter sp. SVR]|nr:hypothetical protein [Geobacter sp. SVR]BCS54082.1 hypothetical protein GSVR_23900 [Geobacter sp. SVR]GCF87565.1 hypothetical protein GSbR_41650 [Geobacter sp. SVR]